ncbi:MAG: FkbM family methyltransferase [Pseudomonadota bacterium]
MKTLMKKFGRRFGNATVGWMFEDLAKTLRTTTSAQTQLMLFHMYREMAAQKDRELPPLTEVGFRCHSQFEEDGILLYIFALIGTTNRVCAEICAGNGIECNTANLILNHGWWGHLFDGDAAHVAAGTAFYREARATWLYPPRFTQAWVTAENVNSLLEKSGATGEIDLLSLDIDGMDYWVFKAIDVIQPRVVVCETHNVIGPEDALTVPYDPAFKIVTPDHHSASLAAMCALAKNKGYRLVGTHRYGFNAFFVREGVGEALLPTRTPFECLQDPYSREARATRWPRVKDLPWLRVGEDSSED